LCATPVVNFGEPAVGFLHGTKTINVAGDDGGKISFFPGLV
jgi:hypothetical protein